MPIAAEKTTAETEQSAPRNMRLVMRLSDCLSV
jgi:hypothetical protein